MSRVGTVWEAPKFNMTCRKLQAHEGTSLGNPKCLAVWPYRVCEQVTVTPGCPWSRKKMTWSQTDVVLEGEL